jgi:hypothetical protein
MWGSAPRAICPHAGHLKTGLVMCRVDRMRPSMSSSSSRRPSRASMDTSSRQRRRRCSTISRNQTRCASPAATAHYLRLGPSRRVGVRRQIAVRTYLTGDVLFWIGDFRVELSPLESTRALRLHRPLPGQHVLHRLYAKHACARTGAQQQSWREVHRGPAPGAAGLSGSVPVCGEGAGTRVRGEAIYSRAEGRVGRQRETMPQLNQHFRSNSEATCWVGVDAHTFGWVLSSPLRRQDLLARNRFRSWPLRGCCSEPTPRRLALDVEATVTHAGDAMQRIQISPGKALCRFCGQQISTNRLSTHIAKEHPRPGPIDMSPTLRKPARVKKRPSK